MSSQANAKISAAGGHATAALVARAAAGDRDAFATIYNEHQADVYRFLHHRTRNRELAQDLTQETFVRALRRIDSFSERPLTGGVGGWLVTIARNLHLDHVKTSRVRLEVTVAEFYEWGESVDSAELGALRDLAAIDAVDAIQSAMAALTPHQRRCVQLRYLQELSIDETSVELGRPRGAIKTLTFRAIANMRRALADTAVAA
ncbi:RNA polymerase sigma factor [Streptomyces sp. NPDC102279]|uniref:RNA polymerase sigma factor n=1 Tax=Streptomyces sp. NPDC102279 TaxID=3366153 RepID=UPI0038305FC4